jgi:hypothetical protein
VTSRLLAVDMRRSVVHPQTLRAGRRPARSDRLYANAS